MKGLSKKLVISLLAFVLTFIGLGASTFAWFTLATTNEVENLTMNVTAGAGLEISLGSSGDSAKDSYAKLDWLANLDSTTMLNRIGNQLKFDAVTSSDGIAFSDLAGINVNAANKMYVKVPIYFKATKVEETTALTDGVGVYLYNYQDLTYATADATSPAGTYIVSEGKAYNAEVPYTDLDGTTRAVGAECGIGEVGNKKYYASEALRVSFAPVENLVNVKFDDSEENSVLGAANMFDFSKNPNYGFATQGGFTYGFVSYYQAKTSTLLTLPTTAPTVNHINGGAPGAGITTFDATGHANNEKSFILPLTKTTVGSEEAYVGKCYMYVWLEGWDADCFDVIYDDTIIIQLAFKLAYKSRD